MTISTAKILIAPENPLGESATQLVREFSAEIARRYNDMGGEGSDSFTPNDMIATRSTILVARLAGQPVGCVALRPMDDETAEVKRMYVTLNARRNGIGRKLLEELERLAQNSGCKILRLEAGNRQPEAIALYESFGFHRIPPFGQYVGDPFSICFEKIIC